MYAISFVFLLIALGTLLVGGFFQDGLTLIWVSIGASVAATIFLIVGVFRRRSLEPATAGAPYGPEEGPEAAQAETVTEPRETRPRAPIPQRRPPAKRPATKPAASAGEAAPPAEKAPAKKPSAKKAPAKKPSAKKPSAKKPSAKKAPAKKPSAKKAPAKKAGGKKTSAKAASSRSQVVSIPERGTYHESGCRFVKGRRDTEKITLATAKNRGYSACGVCKP